MDITTQTTGINITFIPTSLISAWPVENWPMATFISLGGVEYTVMDNNNNNPAPEKINGIPQATQESHIVEEYYYSRWPSMSKFRQSRVTWLTVAVFATAWLGIFNILVLNRPLSGSTWLNAFVVGTLTAIIIKQSLILYRGLFKSASDVRHGTFPVSDPLEPFWVAELDRYTGNRSAEYHRQFVHVTAPSQADAIAGIRHEHNVDDEDIVYIRQVEPEEHHIRDGFRVRSPNLWTDRTGDPLKVYTTWRPGPVNSLYAEVPEWEKGAVLHSVAGISTVAVYLNMRTFAESIAIREIHELVHWALEYDEQPQSYQDESHWNSVIMDQLVYIQEGEHPGPWYDDERRIRAQLTSREARENAAERTPYNS